MRSADAMEHHVDVDSLQVLVLSELLKQRLLISAFKRCLPQLLAAPDAFLHHVLQLRLLRVHLSITDAAAYAANKHIHLSM